MSGVLPTPERLGQDIRSLLADPGYRSRFGRRWCAVTGVPEQAVDAVLALGDGDWRAGAGELLRPYAADVAAAAEAQKAAGIDHTVLHVPPPTAGGLTNEELAARVDEGGGHFVGFARFDPARAEESIESIRRCVTGHGFSGVSVTPFWHRLPASDPAYEPVWELCQELDVVCYVHCSTHPVREVPLSLSHPHHLDVVAGRHPGLRILAGHAGWPWIPDIVALALRHPTVTLEFATFRPRQLAEPGSGWDLLSYHLPRALRRQVVWGSTWHLLGIPLAGVIAEVAGLGLEPDVLHAFTHTNAARMLRLEAR